MAGIQKRSDSSYFITVYCGKDSTGKKITKSTTYHPELYTEKKNLKSENVILKEVKDFAASFEKMVRGGTWLEGKTMRFDQYAEKYITESAAGTQSPRTLQSTRTTLDGFIQDFGYLTLEALTPMYLQSYFNGLYQRKANRGGLLSPSTIRRRYAVLSAALSQAVRWNLIASNPLERVQLHKSSEPVEDGPKCFTRQQAAAFLNALDDPSVYETRRRDSRTGKIQRFTSRREIKTQLKLFFHLAIYTGARRGELISLKWSDINFKEMSVSITKSTCRVDHEIIVKTPKGRRGRVVAVPAAVIAIARQWKKEQAEQRLLIGSAWEGDDYVFTQWNGLQMGLDTPYNAFKRIIDNYNAHRPKNAPELPQIPLHGLRHTTATLLIGGNANIETVAGHLGHANASTTLDIYAHEIKELDRQAVDQMASILNAV